MEGEVSDKNERRDRLLKEAFRYREALLTHAFAMMREWGAAEDCVQDAFLVVVEKYEEFREGSSVYAWVRQIVHYKAMEALRRRAKEVPKEEDDLQKAVQDVLMERLDEEKADSQAERWRALEHCMSQLDKLPLDLLMGFYWKMETCETLAGIHHRTANSIRLILSRVRKKIEACVKQRVHQAASGYE